MSRIHTGELSSFSPSNLTTLLILSYFSLSLLLGGGGAFPSPPSRGGGGGHAKPLLSPLLNLLETLW